MGPYLVVAAGDESVYVYFLSPTLALALKHYPFCYDLLCSARLLLSESPTSAVESDYNAKSGAVLQNTGSPTN